MGFALGHLSRDDSMLGTWTDAYEGPLFRGIPADIARDWVEASLAWANGEATRRFRAPGPGGDALLTATGTGELVGFPIGTARTLVPLLLSRGTAVADLTAILLAVQTLQARRLAQIIGDQPEATVAELIEAAQSEGSKDDRESLIARAVEMSFNPQPGPLHAIARHAGMKLSALADRLGLEPERLVEQVTDFRERLGVELHEGLPATFRALELFPDLAMLPLSQRRLRIGSSQLSHHQTRTLDFIAEGLSDSEIAIRMGLTVDAVRDNVSDAFLRAIGDESRTDCLRRRFQPEPLRADPERRSVPPFLGSERLGDLERALLLMILQGGSGKAIEAKFGKETTSDALKRVFELVFIDELNHFRRTIGEQLRASRSAVRLEAYDPFAGLIG